MVLSFAYEKDYCNTAHRSIHRCRILARHCGAVRQPTPAIPGREGASLRYLILSRPTLRRVGKLAEMEEGKEVRWNTVHGVCSGIVKGAVTRKKDGMPLGYLVQLRNGKYVIVNSKSFIQ